MDEVTQQNAAMVEQAAAATDSLERQGAKLLQGLDVFQLKAAHAEPAPAAAKPARQPAGQRAGARRNAA